MKTALVIMAAGIGSRFGGGIKQLSPVGMNGEIIMDYSIHDAISSGFNKIIIVIRKDIETDFKEVIGKRIEKICSDNNVEIKYVFQDLNDIPAKVPEGRVKPWGTGHAVLCAKSEIDCPFAVINADDYYGKSAFTKIYDYLRSGDAGNACCIVGFVLKNTLSENGGVTRGICCVDENNNLVKLTETKNITKCGNKAIADGVELDMDSSVSMNMWGFDFKFIEQLEKDFCDFFKDDVPANPLKSEFFLPIFVEKLLQQGEISVKILSTDDKWFGATYKEDIPYIKESFKQLTENGVYSENLYSDLSFGEKM